MSKVNCEAVGKRRQASLRMARAELLHLFYISQSNVNRLDMLTRKSALLGRFLARSNGYG